MRVVRKLAAAAVLAAAPRLSAAHAMHPRAVTGRPDCSLHCHLHFPSVPLRPGAQPHQRHGRCCREDVRHWRLQLTLPQCSLAHADKGLAPSKRSEGGCVAAPPSWRHPGAAVVDLPLHWAAKCITFWFFNSNIMLLAAVVQLQSRLSSSLNKWHACLQARITS